MTCLSWNCRGLGNPEAVRELRSIVKLERPTLLFVMETKIQAKRVEALKCTLGFGGCFAVDSVGLSGGIGLFWSRDVNVELKNFSKCHIDVEVHSNNQSSSVWRFTGFYGAPRASDRGESWQLLHTLFSIPHAAWLCMGDFNETLYGSEHFSRRARSETHMRAFRTVMDEVSMQDLGWSGTPYTWDNQQTGAANVKVRLDRAFGTRSFSNFFNIYGSDISPQLSLITVSL